jgi:putative SOS response-associated peptidase YedK
MCGRFVGYSNLEALQRYFPIDVCKVDFALSYNIAPTQEVLAICRHNEQNHLEKLNWGFVSFLGEGSKPSQKNMTITI